MKANEMTFGVEIECTMPSGTMRVGGYHSGIQAEGLPEGWQAMHDGSIRAPRGRQAVEIVSPILKGADGIRQIIEVCNRLHAMNASVNRSTGLHIHVGFDRSNNAALTRLLTLTANFEKALFASTGTKSRERGQYCAPIQRLGSVEGVRAYSTRYRSLNTVGSKPTVEFRAFAGTLNASKIIAHVSTCLGIVERSLDAKRPTKWTAKRPVESSPIHRGGEGQTELNRLFYQLGWTKGRTAKTYGVIETPGAPTVRRMKKTLMRLARKYDEQA